MNLLTTVIWVCLRVGKGGNIQTEAFFGFVFRERKIQSLGTQIIISGGVSVIRAEVEGARLYILNHSCSLIDLVTHLFRIFEYLLILEKVQVVLITLE